MKFIRSFFKFILKTSLCICLVLFLSLYIAHITTTAIQKHQVASAEKNYKANFDCEGYCYVDVTSQPGGINPQLANEAVIEALSHFPQHIQKKIREEWSIVFAPYASCDAGVAFRNEISEDASGVTYTGSKTIFIMSTDIDMWSEVLCHEIAHAVAYEYGSVDCSLKFNKIYEKYIDDYVDPYTSSTMAYITSTPGEFFTSVAIMYVDHPEYLKENVKEAYDFIEEVFERDFAEGAVSGTVNHCTQITRTVCNTTRTWMKSININADSSVDIDTEWVDECKEGAQEKLDDFVYWLSDIVYDVLRFFNR